MMSRLMRYAISNIQVGLDENEAAVRSRIAQQLGLEADDIRTCICSRRNIDARKRNNGVRLD